MARMRTFGVYVCNRHGKTPKDYDVHSVTQSIDQAFEIGKGLLKKRRCTDVTISELHNAHIIVTKEEDHA